jgi:intracellular sulfur oxidation DsrE/DsrF family protein
MVLCPVLIALAVLKVTVAPAQTKHRVVIDLFSGSRQAYEGALGNIVNLRKAMKPEPVEVEVVCSGQGIDLILSHNNPLASRVKKLYAAGVVFAACNNTLEARHITEDRIFPFVMIVGAGIAEVVRKEEAGWSYLRR